MNTLREDLDEVAGAPSRVTGFIQRARREHGIERNEPATWIADLVTGDDKATLTLGRSPGDVLQDARMYADARGYYRRTGTGRWILESAAGDEDADSLLLIVRPTYDPEGATDA